jgi:hypothetical protein
MKDLSPIQIHLTLKDYATPSGRKLQSCLTAALNEARYLTQRDTSTGLPDPQNEHGFLGRWSGAMCYITILDQIGKCYRPKSKPKIENGSSIIKALTYFTTLTEDEINAIYALRNAFFHDFSLLNINKDKPKFQHVFSVEGHPTNSLITLPKVNWDGQIDTRTSDTATRINLKALGDLVEDVYKKLLVLEKDGELILDLPGGEHELVNRYTFGH